MLKLYGMLLLAVRLVLEAQTQAPDCSRRAAPDYGDMARSERLADYICGLVWPAAFVYSGIFAAIDQGNRSKKWGKGAAGYGRLFGNRFSLNVIGTTLQDGSALKLNQDNRYFRSGQRGFGQRLEDAVGSAFPAPHPDGSRSISTSALGGFASASRIEEAGSRCAWTTQGTQPALSA